METMATQIPRTQKQRSATSRRKVIEAVVRCVESGGVTAATTARIAKEAGVTWGVLQHQFGSKHQVFVAVLETSTQELLDVLDTLQPECLPHGELIQNFTDVLWSHYSKPIYRASIEILLNAGHEMEDFTDTTVPIATEIRNRWMSALRDSGCKASVATCELAGEILDNTLSGFAIRQAITPQYEMSFERHISFLVQSVVDLLQE